MSFSDGYGSGFDNDPSGRRRDRSRLRGPISPSDAGYGEEMDGFPDPPSASLSRRRSRSPALPDKDSLRPRYPPSSSRSVIPGPEGRARSHGGRSSSSGPHHARRGSLPIDYMSDPRLRDLDLWKSASAGTPIPGPSRYTEPDRGTPEPAPAMDPPRRSRGHQQIYKTDFRSGFTEQMEYDKDGNERFRPGTKIYGQWDLYSGLKDDAGRAINAYNTRKAEIPRRATTADAMGGSNKYKLGNNFTVEENRELRRMAHTAFNKLKNEAGERRTFNETYGTVWDKRALQTGKPSRKNHEDQAVQKARAAAAWLKKENNHKAVMMELGVPEEEISGYSAWGSERHRWKDDGVPMPEEREYD